ncbi:Sodium/hydrogen exchanger 7 [Halotydeus destructor]|nr:Sodium/hydrogen exchanger 7 [Halotydeus destructor]
MLQSFTGHRRNVMISSLIAIVINIWPSTLVNCYAPVDIKLDEKAKQLHRIDSLNILAYTFLLILMVCTIWLFKRRRYQFLHETSLAIVYGLAIGALIRYVGEAETSFSHLDVTPNHHDADNGSVPLALDSPPDSLWVPLLINDKRNKSANKTFVYVFRGELARSSGQHDISQKATFDPEIFFNIILPPIIFNAGYSLKKRHFFRNIGAIMTYAFLGTTISCFAVGIIMYGFVWLMPSMGFSFNDCLYFGAIISATDPVTILAIFNDLHVDVTLYALVFGESILNDAVAIVLAQSIDQFEQLGASGNQLQAAGQALMNFTYIFLSSLFLGSGVGCSTALLTKFTKLSDFPLLETSLFVLMSYGTFLLSEVIELSGIVAVLFCGITQAHYTVSNLTDESKSRTKQLFQLLNFLAENFIFTYIGVSMFTYPRHRWRFSFIVIALVAVLCGRALQVYPLSFLLNLGRKNKIPLNFQHVLFFSGLRGAVAFALALRNTVSEPRQLMLTTTVVIVIVSVIICGGTTSTLLNLLQVPTGVDDVQDEHMPLSRVNGIPTAVTPSDLVSPSSIGQAPSTGPKKVYEKAWWVRKWFNFDVRYMKPLLTNSKPTLIETLPDFCLPIARILTTTEQLMSDDPFEENPIRSTVFGSDDDLMDKRSIGRSSYNGISNLNRRTSATGKNHQEAGLVKCMLNRLLRP